MRRSPAVVRHVFSAVAAGLAALALVAPPLVAQAQQDRLPTELWEQYPLDPAPGEAEPTEEGPPPARTLEEQARGQGGSGAAAEPGPEPVEESTPWLLLVGATLAFSGVLGIAVGILASRRGVTIRRRAVTTAPTWAAGARRFRSVASLAARPVGAVAVATRWRPSRDVVERLHAEAGSLAPLAEPRVRAGHAASPRKQQPRETSRKAKSLRPAGAPPEKEELPGISPPPHKRKRVTSSLPLGKDVHAAAQEAAGRAAAGGAKAQPALRPMPQSVPPPHGPPARPAERRQSRRVADPVARDWEECEIDWWQGYVKSDFYALAVRSGGERYVAARSPTFRSWRSEPPVQEGAPVEAHARLVALLVADGWEPAGSGLGWYKTRLRRKRRPTLRELAKTL